MQNIGVRVEDEAGTVISSSNINFADILNLFDSHQDWEKQKKKYPWLTSINPYGDTVFNLLQIPYLINELDSLKKVYASDKSIEDCITFLNQEILCENHNYLRFIGD